MPRQKSALHQQALAEHEDWEWNFEQVAAFFQKRGHWNFGTHPVGEWLQRQLQAASHRRLSVERQKRLAALGIPIDQRKPRRASGSPAKERRAALSRQAVSASDDTWERHMDDLSDYHHRFGHYDVPNTWTQHPGLAAWVRQQRKNHQEQRLLPDHFRRLDALGFTWVVERPFLAALWDARYAELRAYQQEHGHTNVTKGQNHALGQWREVQRDFRRKGMLSPDRIARLDAIGFEWEAPGRSGLSHEEWKQQLWEDQFVRLVAFKERFGHCHVPVQWAEDQQLGQWVATQRAQARAGRLPSDRRQRLDDLGFLWKVPYRFSQPPFKTERAPSKLLIDKWETRFAELCAYKEEHGHTHVTYGQNRTLGNWRDVQREFRRRGTLSAERIARLDAIGFAWEGPGLGGLSREEWHRQIWDGHLTRLVAFKDRHGHTQVPSEWPESPALATWVADQRKAWRAGRMTADRQQRLDALGFDWQPVTRPMRIARGPRAPQSRWQQLWLQRFDELAAYHRQHGHTRIPNKHKTLGQLCKWCHSQRDFRRKGILSPERIAELDTLGFEWANPAYQGLPYAQALDTAWNTQFARLTAFHQRFGHSRVPMTWAEDRKLVRWVEKQRKAARNGRLTAERRARLDSLGFVWKPDHTTVFTPRPDQTIPKAAHIAAWHRQLADLLAFQQEHGHLHPSKNRYPKLGNWCQVQRTDQRKGRLHPDRKAALDAIGFDWNPQQA